MKGLDLIAITDHNAVEHSIQIHQLSKSMGIQTLLGVELTTREEVHLLAYFPDYESIGEMGEKISECLPDRRNNPSFFGYQLIYNPQGQIQKIDPLLRQNALQIGIDELVAFIHKIGGIAVPAHIDREHCGLIYQIGFLNPDSHFDAVEVSRHEWKKKRYHLGFLLEDFPVISGSDSHYSEDIGEFFIEFRDETPMNDFEQLKKILKEIKVEKFSGPSF